MRVEECQLAGVVRIGGNVGQAFAAYPAGALVALVLVMLYAVPSLRPMPE